MLHIYQEITLLALRDETGTVSIANLAQALGGAILAELILEKRVSLSPDKKRFVDLLDGSPSGDAVIDECLDKLKRAKRRARLATWVSRFAAIKALHHKAAKSLCELNILKHESRKVFLIFDRNVYPEIDPTPEKEIIERIEHVIFTKPTTVNERDLILISLANASGLLVKTFGRKRLKPHLKDIKSLTEGELCGQVTSEVIDAINVTAVIAATTAVTAASS